MGISSVSDGPILCTLSTNTHQNHTIQNIKQLITHLNTKHNEYNYTQIIDHQCNIHILVRSVVMCNQITQQIQTQCENVLTNQFNNSTTINNRSSEDDGSCGGSDEGDTG